MRRNSLWMNMLLPAILNGGQATFGGNPNAFITSIDTGGGIDFSRATSSTIQTPAFVGVSASAFTATGMIVNTAGSPVAGATINPYQDLEYRWNFGDASSTELMWDPVRQIVVNTNSDQVGGEAVHCYRSAGTYTITCHIRGKTAIGFISATATRAITVAAFDDSGGIFYVDSNMPDDSGNGLTPATAKRTWAQINALASHTNHRFRVAYNSHWKTSIDGSNAYFGGTFGSQHFRMEPYSGPHSTGTSPADEPITEIDTALTNRCGLGAGIGNGSRDCFDIVISNMHFVLGPTCTTPQNQYQPGGTFLLQDIYWDNVIFENNQAPPVFSPPVPPGGRPFYGAANTQGNAFGNGFWYTLTHQAYGNAGTLDGGNKNWWFKMGGTAAVPGVNQLDSFNEVRDHYMYTGVQSHACYKYITYQVCTNGGFLSGANHGGLDNGGALCQAADTSLDGTTGIITVGASGFLRNGERDKIIVGYHVKTDQSSNLLWSENALVQTILNSGTQAGAGFQAQLTNDGVGGWTPRASITNNVFLFAPSTPAIASYYCLDRIYFTGADYGWAGFTFEGGNTPGYAVAISNVIVQNCVFANMNSGITDGVFPDSTIRDNIFWGIPRNNQVVQQSAIGTGYGEPNNLRVSQKIYRNKAHHVTILNTKTSGIGAGTVSCPLQFTDNICYDDRAGSSNYGTLILIPGQHAGSLIDRNQWYAPSYAGGAFINDITATGNSPGALKTLAQWKALGFDLNPHSSYPLAANYGDPGWIDPASGNFNT